MEEKSMSDRHKEFYLKFAPRRNDYFVSLGKNKFNDTYRGKAFYFSEGMKIYESMDEGLRPRYIRALDNIKKIEKLKIEHLKDERLRLIEESEINDLDKNLSDNNFKNKLENKVSFPFNIRLVGESANTYELS